MHAADAQPDQRWFPVARLLRPQGRRGELLADPLTSLHEIFTQGASFRRAADAGNADDGAPAILEDCWHPQGRNAGRLVLKLAGVDSITAAEPLSGQQLFLPEAALPVLEADTYLVRDLVGCSLYDSSTLLGTIVDLQFPVAPDGRTRLPDTADLLVVEPPESPPETETILVPFVKAWLTSADLSNKRIVMQLPPGLLDASSHGEIHS